MAEFHHTFHQPGYPETGFRMLIQNNSNYLTYHTLQKDKVSNLQKLVVEKLLEYKKVLIHEMYFFQAVCLKSLCEPKSDCKRNGFM